MKTLFQHILLFDAEACTQKPADLLITNGMIAKIAESIVPEDDMIVYNMENAYVSDGWVEAHTHMDWENGQLCLDTQTTYPSDGITYAVDAGTNGPTNYKIVHDKMARMPIPTKAYLNVALNGTCRAGRELLSSELLDKAAFRTVYEQYKDEIIGVKIRIDPRVNADTLGTLAQSRELADELGLPLIIHPTRCTDPLEKVLSYLKENDVFAHTYSALEPCILDEAGRVKECVLEARKRGVWFDLSHGSSNFSFDIARKSMDQGFVVDTISTDLHTANITGPVRSMADTMSKMLYLGMPMQEIIRRVTTAPAKMLGLKDRSFGISEGKEANLTFFRVNEGKFRLVDSYRTEVIADQRINVILTVLGEKTFSPRSCIRMAKP